MKQPLFSIVIANYNYGRFLPEALDSIIAQNMGDEVEIIVCDGGSTDNSVEVIKRYEPHIAWWCSEPDGGQSAAFNKGFAHAHGRFLTWLNADDVFMPGALKAIARLHQRYPKAEWLTGSGVFADKNLVICDCGTAHRFSWLRAKYGDLMTGIPSSFFTKRLLDVVGGVSEDYHYLMDIDLWMKFFIAGARYQRCTDFIFALRKHEASKMSGLDVSTAQVAIENRRKSKLEAAAFFKRYHKTRRICHLADIVSFSLIDKIRTIIMKRRFVGKSILSLYEKGL